MENEHEAKGARQSYMRNDRIISINDRFPFLGQKDQVKICVMVFCTPYWEKLGTVDAV